jgi:hypothetical protein
MSVAVLTRKEATERTARALGLDPRLIGDGLAPELIGQALRRASHILAPCARHELEGAVVQSFVGLGGTEDEVAAMVEAVLEELIVYGDILEVRDPDDDGWRRSAMVLRPSPPSFVVRNDGSVVILGVAGDEITPLPGVAPGRVWHRGTLRFMSPEDGEDLRMVLRELGLLELSERVWLRLPKVETASSHMTDWREQLAREPACASLEG